MFLELLQEVDKMKREVVMREMSSSSLPQQEAHGRGELDGEEDSRDARRNQSMCAAAGVAAVVDWLVGW